MYRQFYLDKHYKPEDYAHNFIPIRLQCRICLLDKPTCQCRVWKNTASLWRHTKREHVGSIPEYKIKEIKKELKQLSKALQTGMVLTQ